MGIEVVPAQGRYADAALVVGTQKPGAGACWCQSYRDARLSNTERPEALRRQCADEPGPGVLVYVDDEVAGWCSVAPRSSYRRLMRSRTIPLLDDPRDPWSIVCFVVRAGFRRRGLMHVLLAGAVEHAAAHGAEVVEGYPVETGGTRVDVVSGYVGTVELFEAAGFHRAAPTTAHSGHRERWLVRRELTGATPGG
ncbi:N-acetyltransferase family protein [Cellulomonas sp. 179-A 4D5 NHS]|uniref:GNAT family N-acetyltransferase n=1 Tax=Cellulomonas sp. 179-A 4D5 NHS TaxID=3142378 RepID=UPI0039A0C3AE